jgi:hypothetical protein
MLPLSSGLIRTISLVVRHTSIDGSDLAMTPWLMLTFADQESAPLRVLPERADAPFRAKRRHRC